MNTNLELATIAEEVKFPVGFKPSIQALDGDASIVDHLPLGGLCSRGERFHVPTIGVDDWLHAILALDRPLELVAGPTPLDQASSSGIH